MKKIIIVGVFASLLMFSCSTEQKQVQPKMSAADSIIKADSILTAQESVTPIPSDTTGN